MTIDKELAALHEGLSIGSFGSLAQVNGLLPHQHDFPPASK